MNPVAIVGFGALGVLVVLWLVISFSEPSARRSVLEWAGASALYVALIALFTHLCLRSHAEGNLFALVAFGFLLLLFVSGALVSLVNLVGALRGGSASDPASATH